MVESLRRITCWEDALRRDISDLQLELRLYLVARQDHLCPTAKRTRGWRVTDHANRKIATITPILP